MKIVNNTDLSYKQIGILIDMIMNESVGDTHYVGQVEICTLQICTKIIKVQIRYLKKYVEWRFDRK